MGQAITSRSHLENDFEEQRTEDFSVIVASSSGGLTKSYSLQKLYIPSFEKSNSRHIPYIYDLQSTYFLNIDGFIVIFGNETSSRKSVMTVTFLDRNNLHEKARFTFPSTEISTPVLLDAGYNRVVVRFSQCPVMLSADRSKELLTQFPSNCLDAICMDRNNLIVATSTILIAYNLNTKTTCEIAQIQDISQACLIKAFSCLYCLFDFSQCRAWVILASTVRDSYKASVYPISNPKINKLLEGPIKLRGFMRVNDIFYFFALSGVVHELEVDSVTGIYSRMFSIWTLERLKERREGLGNVNVNCWRTVTKFL